MGKNKHVNVSIIPLSDLKCEDTNSVLDEAPLTRLGFKKLKVGVCDPAEPNDQAGVEGLSVVVAGVEAADVTGG